MIEASKALTGTSTKENCQKKKIKKNRNITRNYVSSSLEELSGIKSAI